MHLHLRIPPAWRVFSLSAALFLTGCDFNPAKSKNIRYDKNGRLVFVEISAYSWPEFLDLIRHETGFHIDAPTAPTGYVWIRIEDSASWQELLQTAAEAHGFQLIPTSPKSFRLIRK